MDGGRAAEDLSDQNNKASKDLPHQLSGPIEHCMCETHRTRAYNVLAPTGSTQMWGSSLPFKASHLAKLVQTGQRGKVVLQKEGDF